MRSYVAKKFLYDDLGASVSDMRLVVDPSQLNNLMLLADDATLDIINGADVSAVELGLKGDVGTTGGVLTVSGAHSGWVCC